MNFAHIVKKVALSYYLKYHPKLKIGGLIIVLIELLLTVRVLPMQVPLQKNYERDLDSVPKSSDFRIS
jgi:hypothetical protein